MARWEGVECAFARFADGEQLWLSYPLTYLFWKLAWLALALLIFLFLLVSWGLFFFILRLLKCRDEESFSLDKVWVEMPVRYRLTGIFFLH